MNIAIVGCGDDLSYLKHFGSYVSSYWKYIDFVNSAKRFLEQAELYNLNDFTSQYSCIYSCCSCYWQFSAFESS